MLKVWIVSKFHKKIYLGEIEKEKFKLHFNHYKKLDLSENEFVVQVPLDVYNYYSKS